MNARRVAVSSTDWLDGCTATRTTLSDEDNHRRRPYKSFKGLKQTVDNKNYTARCGREECDLPVYLQSEQKVSSDNIS